MEHSATETVLPKKRISTYIPTLDGWRAVAVLWVMACHGALVHVGRFNDQWVQDRGHLGVRVFFAISGILICSRLLEEEALRGHIRLGQFYIRRAFRILPVALVFLAVAAVLIAVGHSHNAWKNWFAALFFLRNEIPLLVADRPDGWITAHYWSLSLEEQFYLFLPFLLVFGRKYRKAILAVMIVLLFWRSNYVAYHEARPPEFRSDIALNVLLVPALAALLLRNARWHKFFSVVTRWWPLYMFAIFAMLDPDFSQKRGHTYHGHLYTQMVDFLMTGLVLSTVLNPAGWFSRLLELAPMRWIGRMSYSLYLWQQLFLTQHYEPSEGFYWVDRLHLAWPLTFAFALASYYLLEQPMVRLGHRFTKGSLPGRPSPEQVPAVDALQADAGVVAI